MTKCIERINCSVTTTSQADVGNREKMTEILHDNLFHIIEQHHNQDVDNSTAMTQSNLAMERILLWSSCSLHTHSNVLKPELPLVLPFYIFLISRKPCTWNDGMSKFEAWDFYPHCNFVGNPRDFTFISLPRGFFQWHNDDAHSLLHFDDMET